MPAEETPAGARRGRDGAPGAGARREHAAALRGDDPGEDLADRLRRRRRGEAPGGQLARAGASGDARASAPAVEPGEEGDTGAVARLEHRRGSGRTVGRRGRRPSRLVRPPRRTRGPRRATALAIGARRAARPARRPGGRPGGRGRGQGARRGGAPPARAAARAAGSRVAAPRDPRARGDRSARGAPRRGGCGAWRRRSSASSSRRSRSPKWRSAPPWPSSAGSASSAGSTGWCVGPDRVLAVDFKSNRVVPDRPEAVPEGILRQMGAYAAALAAVWPGRQVGTAILWTRVPTADAAAAPTRRRGARPRRPP